MASYNASLSPPAAFPFDTPDLWPKWKRRFEQYRVASGLSKEAEERQVSTLLYCLGEEAEDILVSTNISDDHRKQYEAVLLKFDNFFRVRKNVIIERVKFNRRGQRPDEPAEQFIASLYNLAADCNFGNLKDELIRDRIVVGIRNSALSEQLQSDPDLTLERAKTLVRQREAIRDQQQFLKPSSDTSASVEAVKSTQKFKRPHHRNNQRYPQTTDRPKKCSRCGRSPHSRDVCPAKDVTCRKCKKTGHFSVMCYTKSVKNIAENETIDSFYLSTIDDSQDSKSWTTQITVNQVDLYFKLDTGAEVTAISEKAFKALGSPKIEQPVKKLCGPTNKPLKVLGRLTVSMSYKNNSCEQDIFVVSHLHHNLLGFPAIKALHLLTRVESINTMTSIQQEFANLFTGLGTLEGDPYTICLQPDVKPFSLGTARNISLPLRDKVQETLNQMEAQGVISKVRQPTPWCAGMVVVIKKSGGVRICVDLKPLNKCVLRERHPLPRVDDTLSQLTGATTFSKLDANSGFWQIPLSEESKLLTTFITPFGRYCYNKLPFGITSAPEHFQQRMSSLLEGLQGVLCVMDDIIVFGTSQQEHDCRLHTVLTRLSSAGITLNSDKCEFSKNSLIFLGHVINPQGISPDPNKTAAISQMDTPKSVTELRRFLGMKIFSEYC